MSSSLQILEKIPCLLFGMSIQVRLKRQSLIHILMESWLLTSMKMEALLLHSAKLPLRLSKLSHFGNGKMKTHATFQHKWTKKLTACKNSLSSIITKDSLQQQETLVFFSGFGKIVKEDLNFTHRKSLQKKLSLKQFSFQTPHRQYQGQKRVS